MKIASFVGANCDLLRQLSEAIIKLDNDSYSLHRDQVFDSSIGGHVRHIVDHYENFISALYGSYPVAADQKELRQRPMINYDQRLRERQVEVDTMLAQSRIAQIIDTLEEMPRADIELDIILQIDLASDSALQSSTLARELSFLHSHTVHHLAIISYILRAMGIEDLPQDFGIAPSTVSFRRAM